MSKKYAMREIAPFKDAEEIKSVVVPQSLWQQGCDDAKDALPRRYSRFAGGASGYTQGYDYGLRLTDPLPEGRVTEPGVYIFPADAEVTMPPSGIRVTIRRS